MFRPMRISVPTSLSRLRTQASIVALLYQRTSMGSNPPLYVMKHKDDNFGDVIHEVIRVLQRGTTLRSNFTHDSRLT